VFLRGKKIEEVMYMKIKLNIAALIASFALFLGLPFSFNNKEVEVKAETTENTFTPTYDVTSYAVFSSKRFAEIVKPNSTSTISPSLYSNVTSVTITNNLDATTLNDLKTKAGSNIYECGEAAYDTAGNPVKTDDCFIPAYFAKVDVDVYECTIYAPVDKIYANQNCKLLFNGLNKCKNINFVNFDTSNVTNMFGMFQSMDALETLDISCFDGSNVEDMSYMFSGLNVKNLVLPAQNFAPKAKSTRYMFQNFNFKGQLTSWNFLANLDTTSVENMSYMFTKACAKENEKIDFTKFPKFTTANVTNMKGMFYDAQGITDIDITSFDTTKVTDMSEMFNMCGLKELDLSNFNTSSVTTMKKMFASSPNLRSITFADNWGPECTDMSNMFYMLQHVQSLDLSTFDTKKVTNMSQMFMGCVNMKTVIFPADFDTSSVTNMSYMFYYCLSLVRVDMSQMDIGASTSVSGMFSSCESLSYVHAPINTLPAGVSIALPKQFNDYASIPSLNSTIESDRIIDILVEYFVARWKELRVSGGSNGVCAALVKGSVEQQELSMLLSMYDEADNEQKELISNTYDVDGVVKIGESMDYIVNVLNGNQTTEGDYGITTNPAELSTLDLDFGNETSLIILISIFSAIAISGYYIISKRKHA